MREQDERLRTVISHFAVLSEQNRMLCLWVSTLAVVSMNGH